MKKLFLTTVIVLVIASLGVPTALASGVWQEGSAVVDGDVVEWETLPVILDLKSGSGELIAQLKGVYSLNPDGTATGYVYVAAEPGIILDDSVWPIDEEHWVKASGSKVPWDAFFFVENAGDFVGFEGSFTVAETYFDGGCLEFHTLTADGETGRGSTGTCDPTGITLMELSAASGKKEVLASILGLAVLGFFGVLMSRR